jgi:hypothetical protein
MPDLVTHEMGNTSVIEAHLDYLADEILDRYGGIVDRANAVRRR